MVHALKLLHRALVPDGFLVDLRPRRRALPGHPSAGFPQVYCVAGDRWVHAGCLTPLRARAQYRAADRALRTVNQAGLFVGDACETFPFIFYFRSLAHLDRAIATRWRNTAVPRSTRRRLEDLQRASRTAQIAVVEELALTVMRKRVPTGTTRRSGRTAAPPDG